MKELMDPLTREMMSLLEELFENPFPPESKYWRAHQKLLKAAAVSLKSINHHIDRELDFARARGIVDQLEKDLEKIGPTRKEVEAA